MPPRHDSTSFQIAVLPGDGIGDEVMASAKLVVDAVAKKVGLRFDFEDQRAGAQHYLDTGVALPDSVLEVCSRADAILFGAMGLPHVRAHDGTEIIPQLDLRFHFDLYAGVRPIRAFKGLPLPLAHPRAGELDFVLVRENTEGLFYARGRAEVRGETDRPSAVFDTMKISRAGTERVCEHAFGIAERRAERLGRPGRVTSIDKANVFTSMALWREVFNEVAGRHRDVDADSAYVDAMALKLLQKPWDYDVLVSENMFGDILSDLAAGLIGGMGFAPSADLGDTHGLFQPAHGTAPDIMGQGKANPTAMLLSAAMMLDWLAVRHAEPRLAVAAGLVEDAVGDVFADGEIVPMEIGGKHGSAAVTRAVLAKLAVRA